MYKLTYKRNGKNCEYESTEKVLFENYLEELKNTETVTEIKIYIY